MDRGPTGIGHAGRDADPPTWANGREAFGICLHRPNRRRVSLIAATVGTLLVGVNQGSSLASGHLSLVVWVRVGLDYLIPSVVSTLGLLSGSRRMPAPPSS